MRYAVALVLIVFTVGDGGAAADSAAECLDALQRDDYDAAVTPCIQAAQQGNASAQFHLGVMYDNGEGVPEDDAKAVEWYTKAAEQGDPWSQFSLGRMYAAGTGVPEDPVQAYKWVGLALVWATLSPDTKDLNQVQRNMTQDLRDRLRRNMTEEQLTAAKRLASEWFEAHKTEQNGD